jgi:hypothetical protein
MLMVKMSDPEKEFLMVHSTFVEMVLKRAIGTDLNWVCRTAMVGLMEHPIGRPPARLAGARVRQRASKRGFAMERPRQ